MHCEMCGRESELFKALIEGTELRVCEKCGKFGKIIGKIRQEQRQEKPKKREEADEEPEIVQMIDENYAMIVKQSRESLGMKQEELAKRLNEKESMIHNIETGHYEPSIALARKLEKFLKIKLVKEEEIEKSKNKMPSSGSGALTIGDIIKIKK